MRNIKQLILVLFAFIVLNQHSIVALASLSHCHDDDVQITLSQQTMVESSGHTLHEHHTSHVSPSQEKQNSKDMSRHCDKCLMDDCTCCTVGNCTSSPSSYVSFFTEVGTLSYPGHDWSRINNLHLLAGIHTPPYRPPASPYL